MFMAGPQCELPGGRSCVLRGHGLVNLVDRLNPQQTIC